MLFQVLSGVGLLLGYRAWRFRRRGSTSVATTAGQTGAGGFVGPCQPAVALAGLPIGLLALFSQLKAICTALAALRVRLFRFLPAAEVDAYWQRAVLPPVHGSAPPARAALLPGGALRAAGGAVR